MSIRTLRSLYGLARCRNGVLRSLALAVWGAWKLRGR